MDNEENQIGVVSYSAPVFNVEGDTVAAISVGILSAKLTDKMRAEIIQDIKLCSKEISRKIGWKAV